MKDYLLSEIEKCYNQEQNIRRTEDTPCQYCDLFEICNVVSKRTHSNYGKWEIEPRDIIELPRKEEFEFVQNYGMVRHWRVYYLDKENNNIMRHQYFLSEFEADEFIEKLKEDRK